MKKILFFLIALLMFTAISAKEIIGKVTYIYIQSGKVYFRMDETGSNNICHNDASWKYYYFYVDKKALESDPYYHEKRFQSFNYFQTLMLSGKTKNDTNPIKVTIDITQDDFENKCGSSSIHINHLKLY